MTEVQVDAAQVHTAAGNADQAAQEVAACRVDDDVKGLSSALADGLTSEAATDLADAWHQAMTRWEQAAGNYSEALTDSGRDYDLVDDASAHLHRRLGRDLGGPVPR